MASSLVTPKMNAALAARVDASVRGRRPKRPAGSSNPRRTTWLRLAALSLVGLVAFAVVRERNAREAELREAKVGLLSERRSLQETLTPHARGMADRLARLIRHESSQYHGIVADGPVRTAADWDRQLSRPLVYARLTTDTVSPPERLDAALSESRPDAFVSCLRQPPTNATEKELMKRVNDIFSSARHESMVNVFRAHDAFVSLRVLDESIDRQLDEAERLEPVVQLQNTWDAARIEERLPALFAEVLLLVIDEPKVPGTPVELDGASVHGVRVVLVDISKEKDEVLFRSHHDSDPNWVSERRRHQYASALESCRLAHALRASAR